MKSPISRALMVCVMLLVGFTAVAQQRYVNPLVIERAASLADPTVIRFEGRYYLYATGGLGPGTSVWVSDELVNWEHHDVAFEGRSTGDAPAAFVFRDQVYVSGNGVGLFRSASGLGPFEYLGDFVDHEGRRPDWGTCSGCETGGFFDPTFFVDDDGRLFLYWAGPGIDGVFGAELDRDDPLHLLGPPTLFFEFEPAHEWERFGNHNEYSTQSWIEGPWMTKREGRYYLQYSAPGTDWTTYAVGVYVGDAPLGPFVYHDGSPLLLQRGGMINGVGHNSVVEATDGSLWTFYNILYRNWDREELTRRIGMDPVGFDPDGEMMIRGPSETPQWAPGVVADPWRDNSTGTRAVSEDKAVDVTSELPGREAPFALDGNLRTYWEPAGDDDAASLVVDLSVGAAAQFYTVDSTRILFPLGAETRTSSARWRRGYRIEVSDDGQSYRTVVDKSANAFDHAVEFDPFGPVRTRYVRLTLTHWEAATARRVLEFTVFGSPIPR